MSRVKPLGIAGAYIRTPQIHADGRGRFLEWFRGDEFEDHLGYRPEVAQGNCSVSRRGVVRGIHYADVPPGQAKYVTCVSGRILDVVVDLRVGSPAFGRWQAVTLDDQVGQAVYLSEGLGHAFMALTEEATVLYLCSTPYNPERERGVHPLDPSLAIPWPADARIVMSERDSAAPTLAEALERGLLPTLQACSERARPVGDQVAG
jgi:dTDP-4-dehydrorhamnose 3,5-epimerase